MSSIFLGRTMPMRMVQHRSVSEEALLQQKHCSYPDDTVAGVFS